MPSNHGDDIINDHFDQVIEEHGGEAGAIRLSVGLMSLCGFLLFRLAGQSGKPPEQVLQEVAQRFAREI